MYKNKNNFLKFLAWMTRRLDCVELEYETLHQGDFFVYGERKKLDFRHSNLETSLDIHVHMMEKHLDVSVLSSGKMSILET